MRQILPALLILGGFFDLIGCTPMQRRELLNEALDNAKSYAQTDLLPSIEKKIDEAIKKQEQKKYDELNAALVELESGTGQKPKTWQEFDEDKDGQLSAMEGAKLTAYAYKRAAEIKASPAPGRPAQDKSGNAKTIAMSVGAILLLALAGKGIKKGVDLVRGNNAAPPTAPTGV